MPCYIVKKLRSYCPEGYDSRVTITNIKNGWKTCTYEGEAAPDVTLDDIVALFSHPNFGSREEVLCGGKFRIVRHND